MDPTEHGFRGDGSSASSTLSGLHSTVGSDGRVVEVFRQGPVVTV